MGLFSAGTLVAALAPGFAVLLARPRRAGQRHRDHAAAADDHRDDARAARPPRRGHGQPLDRHLGGARDRAHRVRGRAVVPGLAGDVPRRPADRAGHAVDRAAAHGRCRRAHPVADRRAVGRAVGRRVRRPRLRPERDRRGRRGCRAAHLGAVRGRRPRHRRVRRAPARAAAHRPRPAGSAHVPLAHVHHRVGDHDADDGHAARLAHPAADLHAETCCTSARSPPACCCCRAASSWACSGRWSGGCTTGSAPARCCARHRRHQPGAVVEHAVRRHEPGLVRPGLPRAALGGPRVRLHPAVHRRPRRRRAAAVLLRQRDLRVHPAARGRGGRGAAGQRAERRRGAAHRRGRHARWSPPRAACTTRSSWPRCSPCSRSSPRSGCAPQPGRSEPIAH